MKQVDKYGWVPVNVSAADKPERDGVFRASRRQFRRTGQAKTNSYCTFFSCFQVVHTTASLAARLIRPVKSGNTRNTHAKEPVDSRPCSLSLKSLLTRAGAFCMTDPVWHGIFVFSLIPRCCCAQEFSKQVQTPDAKQNNAHQLLFPSASHCGLKHLRSVRTLFREKCP